MPEDEDFKILRLRFLRLPPAWIRPRLTAGGKKFSTIEVDLTVGITDDYGVHVGSFDAIELRLEVLDSQTLRPCQGITVSLGKLSPTNKFTLNPSSGDFHPLKATLSFNQSPNTYPELLVFSLSVVKEEGLEPVQDQRSLLSFIGEQGQVPVETWEDQKCICLGVTGGEVELRRDANIREGETSSEKVQVTYRNIYPSSSSSTSTSHIRILERPGLNNSTGQRLWDAAIILSYYLAQTPSAILPAPASSDDDPRSKRRKIDSSSKLVVLELGAGCGLVGMTAALHGPAEAVVHLTDVEETVDTTLRENLSLNKNQSYHSSLLSSPLNWGPLSPSQLQDVLRDADSLTILGSDILYNPESHELLLQTLSALLSYTKEAKALIAYKPRTEGDDNFFEMAKKEGISVEKVFSRGEVGVYEFRKNREIE